MKKFLVLIGVMMVILAGCSSETSNKTSKKKEDKKETIKIACNEFSESVLQLGKSEMEKRGYKVEFVMFDTNILALNAANDGSVDGTFGQHVKFIDTFNNENNGDLKIVKPYTYYTGIGLYSEKYKSLDEIKDGSKIAIMNDAMNMDKGLRMMQDAKLIKLKSGVKSYSLLDIEENPKNIEFVDMEQGQTVRSLGELDGAIVFFTHMSNAGKDVKSYLFRDQDAKEYPIGFFVKEENKNTKWAKDLAESMKEKKVKENIEKKYKDVFIQY